jgi:uncharacterized membrane protein
MKSFDGKEIRNGYLHWKIKVSCITQLFYYDITKFSWSNYIVIITQ